MEITNFLTAENITTYIMAIVIIELWIAFTKELVFIKKIPTKFYTFIITTIHLLIVNTTATLFGYNLIGVYTLLCNSLFISVVLCGGYDIVTNKITFNSESKENL